MSARNPYAPAPSATFPSPWKPPGPGSIAPLQHRFPSHSTTQPPAAPRLYSALSDWRAVHNHTADIPILIDNILNLPPARQHTGEIEMVDTGSADEAWAAWAVHEDLEKVTVDLQVKQPVLAEQVRLSSLWVVVAGVNGAAGGGIS